VRRQGWAIVPDEGIIGFNALAVPVLDASASLAAILGVIGAAHSAGDIVHNYISPRSAPGVCRDKAALSSGCESHSATAPAGRK
jgi:DNA-binding IclR family transcriptional regulator